MVNDYFYSLRKQLLEYGIDTNEIDTLMQQILFLTNGYSSVNKYKKNTKNLKRTVTSMEADSLHLLSGGIIKVIAPSSTIEVSILDTLEKIAPGIALSYKQVLSDLKDSSRISYRGTAGELREVLRETLDILAPDSEVESMPGFKYEDDSRSAGKKLNNPTMKQKVRFILKSRSVPSGSIKAPEDAVQVIEELIASLARSIYNRGSVSAHTINGSGKQDLNQLKMYTDTVLCELLSIRA